MWHEAYFEPKIYFAPILAFENPMEIEYKGKSYDIGEL